METLPTQRIKHYKTQHEREFHCHSWEELQPNLNEWMQHVPFVLVSESNPWEELPTQLNQWPHTVLIMPLDATVENPVDANDNTMSTFTSTPTLHHFLSQPEAKTDYFLRNVSYQDRLKQDITHFLDTFHPSAESNLTLEQLIRKLNTMLTAPRSEHELLIHQWVLEILSLGSHLPPTVSQQLKPLSHLVFDSILHFH